MIRRLGGPGMHGVGGVPLVGLGVGPPPKNYTDKVMGYGPIFYLPMTEKNGTTAVCPINPAMNGTYARDVSVMGTQAGIGDGNTAPTFDGTNDYVNVLTAAFAALFPALGITGSFVAWHLPAAAAHNDGTNRYIGRAEVTVSHFLRNQKLGTNSNIQWDYRGGAGAIRTGVYPLAAAPTQWAMVTATWDSVAGVKYYYNTTNVASLGPSAIWAGNPLIATLGAADLVPNNVFLGGLCHAMYFGRVLTVPEINDLNAI